MNDIIRVLLVEDDPNLGSVLNEYLLLKKFEVTLVTDGEKGWDAIKENDYDLCLLDVMMPKLDGFSLAKRIREINLNIPIIFLTAKNMKEDKIEGFTIGADDYLTKPFSMEELLLRIQAILRRINAQPEKDDQDIFQIGKFTFDSLHQSLKISDQEQHLTSKETELLKMLAIHTGKVLERDIALKKIWGKDDYFTARSMDVFITKLRKYLKPDPDVSIISVHGTGFKLLEG